MSKMGRKVNDVSNTVQYYLLFVLANVKHFNAQGNFRVCTTCSLVGKGPVSKS